MADLPPVSIERLKRRAKAIKKEQGVQHVAALDLAAREAGYQNYAHLLRARPS